MSTAEKWIIGIVAVLLAVAGLGGWFNPKGGGERGKAGDWGLGGWKGGIFKRATVQADAFSGTKATISGELEANGPFDANGTSTFAEKGVFAKELEITGGLDANGTSTFAEKGTFAKELEITGGLDANGTATFASTVDIVGDTTIAGDLEVGDDTHSSITVNGTSKTIQLGVHGDNTANEYVMYMDRASDTHSPTLFIGRSGSAHATPTLVGTSMILGQFGFGGWDGTDMALGAKITAQTDSTAVPASNDMPTNLIFQVSPDGSQTPATALTIEHDKDVLAAGDLDVSGTATAGVFSGNIFRTIKGTDMTFYGWDTDGSWVQLLQIESDNNPILFLPGSSYATSAGGLVLTSFLTVGGNSTLNGSLSLQNVATPTATGSYSKIFAANASSKSELYVLNESGTVTRLTAHANDAPEWFYDDHLKSPMVEFEVLGDMVRYTNITRMAYLMGLTSAERDALKAEERTCIYEESIKEHAARTGNTYWDIRNEAIKTKALMEP